MLDSFQIEHYSFANLTDDYFSKIFELDTQFFPNPWSLAAWKECVPNSERYSLIIGIHNSKVVGFSLFYLAHEEQLGHLLKIVIHPDLRGFNLGFNLLQQHILILQNFKKFYLEVEESNHSAQKLYQKIGFNTLRVLKNFYGSGINGIAMSFGP